LLFAYILYILININVETGWKIWACEPGKSGYHLHPPLLHTPFSSSWCYIIINKYYE
jgi:DsbC/DsbD-like thiol-disulfide interchange protein